MDEIKDKIKAKVEARQKEDKEKVIAELKKMPIVSVACDRASISRDTYYRWHREDGGFAAAADEAMRDGERLLCDLGETQIVSLMRDKHFPAIMAYLRSHHPKYANKLELDARVKADEPLTPEQEELIKRAIGSIAPPKLTESEDAEKPKGSNTDGGNAEEPKVDKSNNNDNENNV